MEEDEWRWRGKWVLGRGGPTTECGVGWECRVLAVSRKGRQANRKGAGAECRLGGA